MALTEKTICDKLEIVNADTIPVIQCRMGIIVEKDGVEIARPYMRYVVSPLDDVSDKPEQIQALAATVFTPEIVAAEKARLAEKAEQTKE
jgi:hypothetical protein